MARRSRQTYVHRFERLEQQARMQRVRRKGHTESKTFLVGVDFDNTIIIPPLFVGLDHDGETPEWKRLTGFAAVLQVGTATITWERNGIVVAAGHAVTTTPSVIDLNPTLELAHADTIQPVITAAAAAGGLSAAVFIVTAAR